MPSAPKRRRQAGDAPLGTVISPAWSGIQQVLHAIRSHLDMDVAFVSQFVGDRRVFRFVDAKGRSPIQAGESLALDEGYCREIIEGRLPELMPDTADFPEAQLITATRALPIGAHLSVPILLRDGRVFGTFCCFSFAADASLNQRDLDTLRVFADLVSGQIGHDLERERRRSEIGSQIMSAIAAGQPDMVYQPVFELAGMTLNGGEALSRFAGQPSRTPDVWFAEAGEVDLRVLLEMQAIRNAVAGFNSVWAAHDPLFLGLNSSPQTVLADELGPVVGACPPNRIVLEITEHAEVEDYDALSRALVPLRQQGVRIAVDDAGSGYASMRHILHIRPDVIKLDISLIRGIDTDATRRALAHALITFGHETGARIVAEGVETAAELTTLRQLGVDAAQGFHLGRPMPLDQFLRLLPAGAPPAA